MKAFSLIALGLAFAALAVTGCTPAREDESTIPWSQPASWENDKMPQMGGR